MQIETKYEIASTAPQTLTFDLKADRRLVGVEAVELDSSGNSQYDIATIALAYTNGAAIDLKVGNIGQGSTLRWQGDIKIQQPIVLVVSFFNPAAGSTLRVNYHIMEIGEPPAAGDSNQNVIQTFPLGRPKIVNAGGVIDATSADFRPGANLQWLVVEANVLHDDGTARTLQWHYTDGSISCFKMGATTVAASVVVPLCSNHNIGTGGIANPSNSLMYPLMLTNKVYAVATASALTAGKKITIQGLVYEFAGGD